MQAKLGIFKQIKDNCGSKIDKCMEKKIIIIISKQQNEINGEEKKTLNMKIVGKHYK